MIQERFDGPTPAGGTYMIITYMDVNHNFATKEQATNFELVEYDAKGEPVLRTYGELTPQGAKANGQ
jgi:hypothetical protein